ncbi:MAG TPA: 16S rRNA (cytosine(967)-C(5))-methyltransferase RsmB [Clostridia bacterium]|nr:16S rRNA (cytosine(967)-C(5))-methyltransferase RsmB [Clostridia bacterium]
MAENARQAAVEALIRVHREGSYSNIALDSLLNSSRFSAADRALLSRLFYGVIERQLTLDYILSNYSRIKLKKMHPTVLELLRVGCYQLVYMDKIPASAAVNESVRLARVMKQERSSGFINAVLRSVERDRGHWFDRLEENTDGLSIRTSCPVWLLSLWQDSYGASMAKKIAESVNEAPPLTLRINTLKITSDEFYHKLEQANIAFQKIPGLEACATVTDTGALKGLAETMENCYYHQDAASQFCCRALEPKRGERIADVCAAPGGKSLTAAQMMENQGEIFACDIYPAKCETIEKRARQMGASIVHTAVRDASSPCPEPLKGRFDRVLCDAPCSGLGAIRRKPEIRYKQPASFSELPLLQSEILNRSAQLVRMGGVLQYSTCTLNPAENEEVAKKFLEEHPEFEPRRLPLEECFAALNTEPTYQITLLPPVHHTDGFYISSFIKTR